jgi:hypothetical protein
VSNNTEIASIGLLVEVHESADLRRLPGTNKYMHRLTGSRGKPGSRHRRVLKVDEQKMRFFETSHQHRAEERRQTPVIDEGERITESLSPSSKQGASTPTLDDTRRLEYRACPECDGHLLRSEPSKRNDCLTYVNIDSVAKFDQLLIETEQSTYIFTVSDPAILWGRLTGGILGNCLLPAYLVKASSTEELITVGNKVHFVFESGNHIERLVTSKVTKLVHVQNTGGQTTPLKGVVNSEHASINTVGIRNQCKRRLRAPENTFELQ